LKELSDCRKVLNLLKYYSVDQADIDFYREVCRGQILKKESKEQATSYAYQKNKRKEAV
jgi:hypothetical protein